MHTLYIVALLVTLVLATFGIFSRHYGDNLVQRIGMSVIGFTSVINLVLVFDENMLCCGASNSKALFIIGTAIYAVGTYVKVHRDNIRIEGD